MSDSYSGTKVSDINAMLGSQNTFVLFHQCFSFCSVQVTHRVASCRERSTAMDKILDCAQCDHSCCVYKEMMATTSENLTDCELWINRPTDLYVCLIAHVMMSITIYTRFAL